MRLLLGGVTPSPVGGGGPAAGACGNIEGTRATEPWMTALTAEAGEVRGAARWALAQLDSEYEPHRHVKVRPRGRNRI